MTDQDPSRRRLLGIASAFAALPLVNACANAGLPAERKSTQDDHEAARSLAALEAKAGGRLGAAMLNSVTGAMAGHRLDERFAMCSVFKWPLSAAVLRQVEDGRFSLGERIDYGPADLLDHAPVARANAARGWMSIEELMDAAVTTSDNSAANLLIAKLGGPDAVTRQFRAWGDSVTRLDRIEPMMNIVEAGDERDTSTPGAMAKLMRTILFSDSLAPASRTMLIDWGIASRTGLKRLRAGFPADWRAGDKTGTGTGPGAIHRYNDVALAFPPDSDPLIIAAFYDSNVKGAAVRDADQAVLAEVGRIASRWATPA